MNIMVTGSRGYIGQHLIQELTSDIQVDEWDITHPSRPRNINMTSTTPIEYDTIVHLAASVRVNESVLNPKQYYENNVSNTIELLKNNKFKNLVFASTGAAEHMSSPYAISKKICEDIIQEHCYKNNIPYTIFRFYNVIGTKGYPATNPDGLMSNLVKALHTGYFTIHGNDYPTPDGTAIRDYVHVVEIVRAIQRAMIIPANSIQNLGHGVGHSVKFMAERFRELNQGDYTIEYAARRPGDPAKSVLDNPSVYLENLYTIDDMLQLPKSR